MKHYLLTAALLLGLGTSTMMGVPARRDIVHSVTQPDGTVVGLTRIGDEHTHYYLTSDRLPVLVDAEGRYCYATLSDNGTVTVSEVLAANPAERTESQRAFVATLNPEAIATSIANRRGPSRANQSTGKGLSGACIPHMGNVKALVILVQFTDSKFKVTSPHEYFTDFLTKEGFSQHKGTGSVRDYFIASSAGNFTPEFDLYGPVSLPNNCAYYGSNDVWGNDLRPGHMVYDACKLLDSEVNFKDYDLNGDGYVDNVYIIYAGKGEASYGAATTVWPHRWTMSAAYGSSPSFDGVRIEDYGCCNEWDDVTPCGIGTFCHEFSHVLGLPDLYTTTYSEKAMYLTPGPWSVMDYGSYNNDGRTPPSYSIFERNAMGWIDPIVLDGAASVTLDNIHDTNQGCIALTSSANEFFLFENRQQTGWDKYLPGHGMIVWHIDYNNRIWENNSPNNDATHQYIDIEEAGGRADNDDSAILASYPFPGTSRVTSFTDDTKPSMLTWAGKSLGLPITNIVEKGGIITFDVAGGLVELSAPEVKCTEVAGNGFTLTWDAVDQATSYLVNVSTRTPGANIPVNGYVDLEVKTTSVVVTRLQPMTDYVVTVTAKRGDFVSDPSAELAVTTGQATFDMVVPVATAATGVTRTSFTANWYEVDGATDYLLTVTASEQVAESSETADMGAGNVLKLPEGWSSNSNNYYGASSTNYYGESAPSLKLMSHGHYLATPLYDNDIVGFKCWVRNAGTTKTNYIEFVGLVPPASGAVTDDDWVLIYTHSDINNTAAGDNIVLDQSMIPAGVKQIKLIFNKITSGNLAVDDATVTIGGEQEVLLAGYDKRSVGNVTSYELTALPADVTTYHYTVTGVNAAGVRTEPSDPIEVHLTNDGVSDIDIADADITVSSGAGVINIEATAGTAAVITDLSGRTVATVAAPASVAVAPGFYIVAAGNRAYKLQVK